MLSFYSIFFYYFPFSSTLLSNMTPFFCHFFFLFFSSPSCSFIRQLSKIPTVEEIQVKNAPLFKEKSLKKIVVHSS
ncbi:Hypothetical protein Minf_1421 [Methylacidiphilum infernorum V4]|uniref:Uncharacterized protein n=1 Tax=Methylacidiphilum infernorum (isolate V4) TaxID=481448 RepID=B3DVX2_METI4|nr:Hypothetical protein Minf_1421 [Methylacidiphilum infernorum V4]